MEPLACSNQPISSLELSSEAPDPRLWKQNRKQLLQEAKEASFAAHDATMATETPPSQYDKDRQKEYFEGNPTPYQQEEDKRNGFYYGVTRSGPQTWSLKTRQSLIGGDPIGAMMHHIITAINHLEDIGDLRAYGSFPEGSERHAYYSSPIAEQQKERHRESSRLHMLAASKIEAALSPKQHRRFVRIQEKLLDRDQRLLNKSLDNPFPGQVKEFPEDLQNKVMEYKKSIRRHTNLATLKES